MPQLTQSFRIGHWTDPHNLTGCTVILCPPGTHGSCDVRGASPGSRETALLSPEKTVDEVHAVLLAGGSAYGLAAADGVMKYLSERGIGYRTPWAIVPIVPAAVIFDLAVGANNVYPTRGSGYAACIDAGARNDWGLRGPVGAGTGATVGKWAGPDSRMDGGLGISTSGSGDVEVVAVAVVNAVGDIIDGDGKIIAGARGTNGEFLAAKDPSVGLSIFRPPLGMNTTLVAVVTNAALSKLQLCRIAERMHDGLARAIVPSHTSHDGDTTFALACGNVAAPIDLAAELAVLATAEAIRDAVRHTAAL